MSERLTDLVSKASKREGQHCYEYGHHFDGVQLVRTWYRKVHRNLNAVRLAKANIYFRSAMVLVVLCVCSLSFEDSNAETVTILAFGDSITQGLKRDSNGLRWGIVEPQSGTRVGGYETYLEEEFSAEELTRDCTAYVYNWGAQGEKTIDGVPRLNEIFHNYVGVYDYCLLMEGANDLYAGISPSTTAFNLGVMVDYCRTSGVTPILATITPNTAHSDGSSISRYYNPAIIKIAESKNVILADQFAIINPKWSALHSGDGLHILEAGDQLMAKVWYDALMEDKRFAPPFALNDVYLLLLEE